MFTWFNGSSSDAAAAMKRVIILKYIFVKALATPPIEDLGGIMSQWSAEERSQFAKETASMFDNQIGQLKSAGLWQHVEEDERRFLQSGADQLTPKQRTDASWLAESIVCLLWALQIVPDLPPYDQEAGQQSVKKLPARSIGELIRRARLRPKQEIKKQRDLAELWHWRARTRKLQEDGQLQGQLSGGLTIHQIIEMSAAKGADKGDLPSPIESDFPSMGKPYRDLSSDEFATMTSIAQERHKAFNWLCGMSPSGLWADTPTGT